jgi:phosphoribosylamine-glycine ligase
VYFLEFTPRFGYDAIYAMTELCRKPFFDYLWKLQLKQSLPSFREEYAIAVRLSMPPYPFGDIPELKHYFKMYEGVQVLQVPKEAERHIHYYDVQSISGKMCMAGIDGALGCVTARGATIRECQRRVYRTIKNIVISKDVQYRSDIGSDWQKDIDQLKEWGWL